MKNIFFIVSQLFILSCGNKQEAERTCRGGSFEFYRSTLDTVNLIDCDSMKQGKWQTMEYAVLNKHLGPERIKTEEGFYRDNKKEGVWRKFSKTGEIIDSVTYKNDVAVH